MTRLHRLFIAINFSAATKKQLAGLISLLQDANGQGRFCQPDQLHLTLAFLGNCRQNQLELSKKILAGTSFSPFNLTIDRVDRFTGRGGDIWWAGLQDQPLLNQLQSQLAQSLKKVGFLLDARTFRPHITLGRAISCDLAPQNVPTWSEQVRQIDLMESVSCGGKMVYNCIYSQGKI